jgi:hypothetical protein
LKETKAVIPPGININVDWKSGNVGNSTIVTGVSGSTVSISAGKKDDNKK